MLTHVWSWNVIWASLPYVLGVTTVIFGKHIDKVLIDKAKKIFTLPVLIGEKAARYAVVAMMALPYLLVLVFIFTRYFTPVLLLVFIAVPTLLKMVPQFLKPKPETRPEGFPDGQGGWPLYLPPGVREYSCLWHLVHAGHDPGCHHQGGVPPFLGGITICRGMLIWDS